MIPPIQIVLLRILFGLIPIALYAAVRREFQWDHARHIVHLMMMTLVATLAYYYGFAKGSSLLLSGVVCALSALTPILSFLLALLLFIDLDGIGAILEEPAALTGMVFGLGVLGTSLATIICYFIIDKLGAVSASSVAYIPPVVAMVTGVVLVSEPINAWEYLGAVLIMGGLVLVNRRPREKA